MAAIPIPTTRIPFQDAGEANHFAINIRVPSGQTCNVLLDTGSTGVVLPAHFLHAGGDVTQPVLPGVTGLGIPGSITYYPSGIVEQGSYYRVATLQAGESAPGQFAGTITDIVVLGTNSANGYGMMGIGFGKPGNWGNGPAPSNPFLNFTGMATGSTYASYLLSRTGIWVGHAPEDLAQAFPSTTFGFQKLTGGPAAPCPNSGDWNRPAAAITLTASGLSAACTAANGAPGTVVLDTGIQSMMLEMALGAGWPDCLPGTTLTISVPGTGSAGPILTYSFALAAGVSQTNGDETTTGYPPAQPSGPMAPTIVLPRLVGTPLAANFVNTGINVLSATLYYFDAKLGQVGFAACPAGS